MTKQEKYRKANRAIINERNKAYREANRAIINERNKVYRESNPDKISKQKLRWYELNKENIKKRPYNKVQSSTYSKKFYEKNKVQISTYSKKFYEKNKVQISAYSKKYYEKNKERIKQQRLTNQENANKRVMERKKTDPLFRLRTNIRSLIRETINSKGYKKQTKSQEILGCTFEEFKQHLESKFESWMSWDNYGNPKDGKFELNKTWDIDHIISISSGKTEDDVIKLNHYTNLQPLCSYYNRWVKKNIQR